MLRAVQRQRFQSSFESSFSESLLFEPGRSNSRHTMAKVKAFQKVIVDDADWKETIAGEHVFIEVHPSWCGPCECVKPMLWRISLDKEDIKFCTAASDKIQAVSKYQNQIKPVFLYYRRSVQKGKAIEGVNAPEMQKLLDNV